MRTWEIITNTGVWSLGCFSWIVPTCTNLRKGACTVHVHVCGRAQYNFSIIHVHVGGHLKITGQDSSMIGKKLNGSSRTFLIKMYHGC